MRSDLGLVGFDDGVERRGIGVALLDQNGLERTHPQLGFRQLGRLVIVIVVVMLMGVAMAMLMIVVRGHERS